MIYIGYIETIRTKDAHCGIPVYSPSEICKQTYDAIIVSSHYVDAIYYTLIEQGIDIKKVIFFHKFWNDGILKSNKWKKSILGDENYYQYIKNQTVIRAYSQCDQDLVVLGIFAKNKLSKGRYIDIDAHDGVSLSNTKIFEEIGWDGICIEPNPDVFKLLMKNRRSINLNVDISDKNGTADFIKVNGKSEMLSGIADFMSESHEKRINQKILKTVGIARK